MADETESILDRLRALPAPEVLTEEDASEVPAPAQPLAKRLVTLFSSWRQWLESALDAAQEEKAFASDEAAETREIASLRERLDHVEQVLRSVRGSGGILVRSGHDGILVSLAGGLAQGQPQVMFDEVPSGAIVLWDLAEADVPPGWTICDGRTDSKGRNTPDMRYKVPVGLDASDPDYDAIGKTGGYKKHGGDENDHDDHPVGSYRFEVSTNPADEFPVVDGTHSETDNRQPFYTLYYIRKD